MDVIIMAGGLAQRLSYGEKACLLINKKPLISYIIQSLKKSKFISNIFVSTTKNTPKTKELIELSYPEIKIINSSKGNYVRDMIQSVNESNTIGPIMIIMCDIPLIKEDLIDQIIEKYFIQKKDALSTYIPISTCQKLGIRPDTVFKKNGQFIVPVGINILNSIKIEREQEDFNYIIDDERLAININSQNDLNICIEKINNK